MKNFEEITRGIEEIVTDKSLSLYEKSNKLRENFLITERDICNDEKTSDCIDKETFEKLQQFVKEKVYPVLIENIGSVEDFIVLLNNVALPVNKKEKWVFNDYEIVDEIYQKLFDEGYIYDASLEELVLLYNIDDETGYSIKEELPDIAEEIEVQINNEVVNCLDEMELEKILYAFEVRPWVLSVLSDETKEELKEKINSLSEEEKEKWEEFLEYLED